MPLFSLVNTNMGRRKTKYLTYEDAKNLVQMEEIQSRVQYFRWWELYKPRQVPKHADYVYRRRGEWKGWNDYLGNDNEFRGADPHRFRSFEEALLYARSIPIERAVDWWEYDGHPYDIPKRPDLYYRGEFCGWRHFLGKGGKMKAVQKVMATRMIEEKVDQILLFSIGDAFLGSVRVDIVRGMSSAREHVSKHRLQVMKAFKMEDGFDLDGYLKQWGTDYGDGEWKFDNVHEMLFNIDLEWIR
jgi:hypothetical protein